MSLYSRIRASAELSAYSDYGNPSMYSAEWTDTPGQFFAGVITATTSAVAFFNSSTFAAGVKSVIIQNLDTTNYVTVIFASTDTATNKQRIAPGEIVCFSDILYSGTNTLTANTASCLCRVLVLGT